MNYVIKSGDTLGAVAARHDTTVSAILAANPQITNPNVISVGQQIALPGSAPVVVPPAGGGAAAGSSSYVIKSGDTLGVIAAQNNTTVNAIMEANPQIRNPNQISVGQRITIPGGASSGGSPGTGNGGGSPGGSPGSGAPQTGTWTLPDSGEARRLVASDFSDAARQLDCETAAVRAVAEVESGGRTGFDANRRPKILFEIHLFRNNTNRRFDRTHPHLSAPYSSPLRRQSYRKDQWTVIREAFALDPEAAVKSASWGMFQVLGSNAISCGWSTVRQFSSDMFVSEAQHMRAFLGFCRANNLVRHLRTKNWAAFARGYNGPDYASNAYDTKMAAAYTRYRNP